MNIEVLDLRINDPQPSEQFKIRFPPGCVVEDQTTMKDYVIQDDGGMRERSPQGELLTDSIPQPGTPWYRRHQGLLISGAVVVVLLAFTHFLRRKVEKGK
jgi:hypothetical protein